MYLKRFSTEDMEMITISGSVPNVKNIQNHELLGTNVFVLTRIGKNLIPEAKMKKHILFILIFSLLFHLTALLYAQTESKPFLIKAGTEVVWYGNGKIQKYTLAENWKAPNGMVLKAGNEVIRYENGNVQKYTLAENWKAPNGMVLKAGTEVMWHENGKVKKYTPAENWGDSSGILLKNAALVFSTLKWEISFVEKSKNKEYLEHQQKGLEYYDKGKYDLAIDEYTKALELNPNISQLYLDRGESYTALGKYDKAIDDFTEAIELAGDSFGGQWREGYYYRAETYCRLANYDQVKTDIQEIKRRIHSSDFKEDFKSYAWFCTCLKEYLKAELGN